MNKKCKDCGKFKSKDSFYGVQGECKKCTQKRVQLNYRNNINHYIEYEKIRDKDPIRKANKLEYQRTRRNKFKGKNKAREKLNKAVKNGKIIKGLCIVCKSNKVEAHHKDYRKPLDVVWVCRKHHMELENKIAF